MVGLLTAVQKVEVVGGESWLSHNLGPILLATAAITAAVLAAWVATRNHRQQLEHDRQLRNQDHIRDTVDDAIAEVMVGLEAISTLYGVVQGIERWRDETPDPKPQIDEPRWERERQAASDVAAQAIVNMLGTTTRLQIRLGASHPIVRSCTAVLGALNALEEHAPSSVSHNRKEGERERDKVLADAAQKEFANFRKACFEWFNE